VFEFYSRDSVSAETVHKVELDARPILTCLDFAENAIKMCVVCAAKFYDWAFVQTLLLADGAEILLNVFALDAFAAVCVVTRVVLETGVAAVVDVFAGHLE